MSQYSSYPVDPSGQPYPGPGGPAPVQRPGTVVAGCVLAWIGAAIGVLGGALLAAFAGTQEVRQQLIDQGVATEGSVDDQLSVFRVSVALLALWCLAVAVVTVFAFLGRRWAGITTMIMGALFIIYNAITSIISGGAGAGFIGVIWVLLSVLLIWRIGGAQAWFKAKEAERRGF